MLPLPLIADTADAVTPLFFHAIRCYAFSCFDYASASPASMPPLDGRLLLCLLYAMYSRADAAAAAIFAAMMPCYATPCHAAVYAIFSPLIALRLPRATL